MIKICEICNKTFNTNISTKKYCSSDCRKNSHKLKRLNNCYKGKNVICKNCKKTFNTKTQAIYCCEKCRIEARLKRKNLINNKIEIKDVKDFFRFYCINCNPKKGILELNNFLKKDSTSLYWKLRREYMNGFGGQ